VRFPPQTGGLIILIDEHTIESFLLQLGKWKGRITYGKALPSMLAQARRIKAFSNTYGTTFVKTRQRIMRIFWAGWPEPFNGQVSKARLR
jgi:hypothetical protein